MKKKALYPLTLFKLVRTLLVFRTKRVPEKANGKKHKHPQERKLKVPQKARKINKKKMEKWYDEKDKMLNRISPSLALRAYFAILSCPIRRNQMTLQYSKRKRRKEKKKKIPNPTSDSICPAQASRCFFCFVFGIVFGDFFSPLLPSIPSFIPLSPIAP